MVFASRGETISGGNFHGEYPAKVSLLELLLPLEVYSKYKPTELRYSFRPWTTWPLVSMNLPRLAKEELKGSVTLPSASCLPSWWLKVV